jgi:hypothetical protein
MTNAQALDLARQRDAETRASNPHNRRSLAQSWKDRKTRKNRRRLQAQTRAWVASRAARPA